MQIFLFQMILYSSLISFLLQTHSLLSFHSHSFLFPPLSSLVSFFLSSIIHTSLPCILPSISLSPLNDISLPLLSDPPSPPSLLFSSPPPLSSPHFSSSLSLPPHPSGHRVSEAVIFVDVPGAGGQLDALSQTHTSPLGLRQFRSWDAVHLPCLTALIHHTLSTEPQTAIILGKTQ